jgi:hypothetical protein
MIITTLKRVVVIEGVNIHISIVPSPYPDDVGRHTLHPEKTINNCEVTSNCHTSPIPMNS